LKPDAATISSVLQRAGIAGASVEDTGTLGVVVRVDATAAREAVLALRDSDHSYSMMVDLFGIDTGEAVDVAYHLRSISRDDDIFVKAAHAYGSTLRSIWEVFPAALMPERECAEMFGLSLSGHPNPKHLLLTEKVGPLLLKSVEIRGPEEVRNR
jgi:NADH-quinone oxidoreductase subunit C